LTDTDKQNSTGKANNTKYSKTKLTYDIRPGNETGSFYNVPQSTEGV